jgi:hypothetical protein
MASHEDVLLAESEHYAVRGYYEVAVLIDKRTNIKFKICEMYGDPEGALIDSNETFAVVYGCGAVVCRIPDMVCTEISDKWVISAEQTDTQSIRLTFEDGSTNNYDLMEDKR